MNATEAKIRLKEMGLKQTDVANIIGMSSNTMSRVLRGEFDTEKSAQFKAIKLFIRVWSLLNEDQRLLLRLMVKDGVYDPISIADYREFLKHQE